MTDTNDLQWHSPWLSLSTMDNNDFDSISWGNEGEAQESSPGSKRTSTGDRSRARPSSSGKQRASSVEPQVGRKADPLDLAGVGDGRLDCTVDTPQKENDGTKDVFVSYLVTTHVGQTTPLSILSM